MKLFRSLVIAACFTAIFVSPALAQNKSRAHSPRRITVQRGTLTLELNASYGSFLLSEVGENGRPRPLLSAQDGGAASFFALKAGERQYRLRRGGNVNIETVKTPLGAQMSYTVDGVAQVVVDFSLPPSGFRPAEPQGLLRVTVYTINLGKSAETFSVKAVLDTILGENTSAHFSTAARNEINGELCLTDMRDDLWIRSADKENAVQFLLAREGITEGVSVTLSNKEALEDDLLWLPKITEGRSFASAFSYGNSAVCIAWDDVYLEPLARSADVFFISAGADETPPPDPEALESAFQGEGLPEIYIGREAAPQDSSSPEGVLDEDGNLNPEYVRRVLSRVDELSQSGEAVSEEEAAQLNASLDVILETLESNQ